MELSTNLIKHAGGGEIWILESDKELLLASLDYGDGIKDIEWSRQNGTTRMSNSLGIGLHQINSHEYYVGEISSFTSKDIHGTVVLIRPKKFNKSVVTLQTIYDGELVCGDMFAKKGRFLLLADGSGHGKKANRSVEFVKEYFYDHPFSCILVDEFFKEIHETLKKKQLRGCVLSLFEVSKKSIEICGVGNIATWVENMNGSYKYLQQKDGILGEVFSSSDKKTVDIEQNRRVISATDGIDIGKMNSILKSLSSKHSSAIIALNAIHFAPDGYDDRTVIVISNKG